ncbi:MAG: hypothetical protein AAGH49_05875 [Pseudomonadota bacterium]
MNDTTLQDDLAYVRDLAEAGQQAPLLGGRFLTFWGVLTSIAYFLHFAMTVDWVTWPNSAYAWVWGSFIVVGMIGQTLLGYSIRNKPGSHSVGNRSEATVWMAGGVALFVYFGILIIKSLLGGETVSGFETSLPIVFAIYGTGLITSGLMGGVKTLTYAGFGAFAMLALAVWFDGTDFSWAVASFGAFCTVLVPGLVLLRNEPKSIV